jgi:hypothetical protein
MIDFIEARVKNARHLLRHSKLATIAWGVLVTGFAFLGGDISDTVIESINKTGSAFAGSILATFIVGVLSRGVRAGDILVGLASHFSAPPPAATIDRYTLTGAAGGREPEKTCCRCKADSGFISCLCWRSWQLYRVDAGMQAYLPTQTSTNRARCGGRTRGND